MAFNTKINLDSSKVTQSTGSTLNLSGTTNIYGLMKYGSDVSGSYNVRSFVDKGYVTGITTGLLNNPTFTGTPVAPTATLGTNTTQIATTAFVQNAFGSINPIYLSSPIITDTWSNLSNWTNVGSGTFSVSSNVLTVNGGTPGSAVYTNYIRNSNYSITNLENWIFEPVEITVGTINGTSWGVGLGVQKVAAGPGGSSFMGVILLDSTNKGKIAFYFDNTTTLSSTSDGFITINSGDVLSVTLRRDKAVISMTVTNKTTNPGRSITHSYQYELGDGAAWTAAGSQFAIYALGGSHTISNTFAIKSQVVKNANFMALSDSEHTGFFNSTTNNRLPDLLNQSYLSFVVNGSPGLRIEEINVAEVLAHTPDKIIIMVGVNNVAESTATVMARYATLVSALSGYTMGTNLFITTWLPVTTADVTAHNTAIRLAYPTGVIDLFASAWSGISYTPNPAYISTDGVHYNAAWSRKEVEIFTSYFGLKPNTNSKSSAFTPFYSNGLLGIGFKNSNEKPKTQLDVMGVGNTSQIRVSKFGVADGGIYLSTTSANDAYLSAGSDLINGAFRAKATSAGIYAIITGGVHNWYSNTGLTASNTYTITNRMNLSTVGLSIGNGSTAATQKLDVTGNIRFSGALMPNNIAGTSGQFLISQGSGIAPIFSSLTSNNGVKIKNNNLYLGGQLTGSTQIGLTANNLVFSASTGTVRYAADYSSNFNVRSLVDKGYVTGQTELNYSTIASGITDYTVIDADYGKRLRFMANTDVTIRLGDLADKFLFSVTKVGLGNLVPVPTTGVTLTVAGDGIINTQYTGAFFHYVKGIVTWEATGAFTEDGDVPADSISNIELANMPQATIKGRTSGTGDPEDLTDSQARSVMKVYSTGETTTLISSATMAKQKLVTGTTYTLSENDKNSIIYFSNSSAISVSGNSTTLSSGYTVTLVKSGSTVGNITFIPVSSILNAATAIISVPYSGAKLIRIRSDRWHSLPYGNAKYISLAASDETTALTSGTTKVTYRMPHPMIVTNVYAELTTAQASGNTFTVDINKNGTTILSTKLTIDNTEDDSATASTPAVISVSSFALRDKVTVDIDQIGNGSAKGLKVTLVGY